jgi:poly-gamma-glutamate capsule biosynthesis protein CapA/YwtB (metallophosphatase superfamily)
VHTASRARRRGRLTAVGVVAVGIVVAAAVIVWRAQATHTAGLPGSAASGSPAAGTKGGTPAAAGRRHGSPLSPRWTGDGKPVTLAFGGDVHFEGPLAARLAADPATALDGNIAKLLSGADISMTNFESALVYGACPDPQPKQFVFWARPAAITAFKKAKVTLVTEANNHGEDCGRAGLEQSLAIAKSARYPIIGIGRDAAQAFRPYRTIVNGERLAIIAATEVIDTELKAAWTATSAQPGLASAYQEGELVAAVQAARKTSDTVIVFLHWGTETQQCPNPVQGPLARALVKAGADIVVGAHAHVQLGAGYLGSALIDYGLGNLAFYDTTPPETYSGALLVTVTGRHIDRFSWRPALIESGLPVPQAGGAADAAIRRWRDLRSCTGLSSRRSASKATAATETTPFAGPAISSLADPAGTSPGTTRQAAAFAQDG